MQNTVYMWHKSTIFDFKIQFDYMGMLSYCIVDYTPYNVDNSFIFSVSWHI